MSNANIIPTKSLSFALQALGITEYKVQTKNGNNATFALNGKQYWLTANTNGLTYEIVEGKPHHWDNCLIVNDSYQVSLHNVAEWLGVTI